SKFKMSSLWLDNAGLAWIDPAAKESWDYNIAIAREVAALGFDEINFDYIRFPSDGNLRDMSFPLWDENIPKHSVIKEFFGYLRQELPDVKLSVDLFGLSSVSFDDLGIGQIIEDAFEYFDYVCPMVYPSHYAYGFLGYQNPAAYPYEVVKDSMEKALGRLAVFNQSKKVKARLRPWLQDFNLGAVYDAAMVRSEIAAVYDAAKDDFSGFMLWNSSNVYTIKAFQPIHLE
ncbi:MAG TPA: putative glycoside hydrolase, partial [Patescibacteria group bacterium]|nr:putative glycoside hydrolase [Patescibacteria group bacterium]